MALLYGRAARLTAHFGIFRPGQTSTRSSSSSPLRAPAARSSSCAAAAASQLADRGPWLAPPCPLQAVPLLTGAVRSQVSIVWRQGIPRRGEVTLTFTSKPRAGSGRGSASPGHGAQGGASLKVRCELGRRLTMPGPYRCAPSLPPAARRRP
jgi:hypothetical protein